MINYSALEEVLSKMKNEVLFTIAKDPSYDTVNDADRLEGLMKKRELEPYYDNNFVEDFVAAKRRTGVDFSFNWSARNAPGEWMSQNIRTPSSVIDEPISLGEIEAQLSSSRFSHVVIATYLSGYSTFREISRYVHRAHPDVKVVAASVGALIPESQELADYLVKGDLVGDLRDILGERREDALKPVTMRSDSETIYKGQHKKASYGILASSLGCMYGCDFCPSTAQFGTSYSAPFSAEQIRGAIIQSHDQIAPDDKEFTISIAEPQGLGNIKLWKSIFEVCRNLPFVCNLISTTSSKVIQGYTLDELTGGNLRLATVNIGVESQLKVYRKNQGAELKRVYDWLQNAGINVASTLILGLDWHDQENVWEEVRLLKALESSINIVASLEMQPNTPLYNQYKRQGRLLDVPPELLSFYGYQAFLHPNFRQGFNDMLPLLDDIKGELYGGDVTLGRNLDVFLNRKAPHEERVRVQISQAVQDFGRNLDPSAYHDGGTSAIRAHATDLYFKYGFRQVDLFYPFILSTN
ncbi:hypothetical protein KKE78_01150 [Patescibacteria group bacterium]|nr:hypothetical protein [Patescibacteria group bacterium]